MPAQKNLIWDEALIQKYNYSGPRYTSYPTALEFHEQYSNVDFLQAASRYPERALSLYIHIPFCHKLCYFCACNKIVTRHRHRVEDYLQHLTNEIAFRASLFSGRIVTQMHWGGGTPTFLNSDEIERLMQTIKSAFHFSEQAELSIEIDPREIELETLDFLKSQGFNRISMGVQDFNKEVQQVVNREQDEALIFALMQRAKALNFRSTNIDLIYGLPKQTVDSFNFTLAKVVELNPDRLSVFNYAHLPERFAAQRKIKSDDFCSPQQKLVMLHNTIDYLTNAGYQFIGMDHFAKPDDELAIAQRSGQLHRNFQGYTTQGDSDLLGLGVSAISMLGDHYVQNRKELKAYYHAIEQQQPPIYKGLVMSNDDCIRRDVIKGLICNFQLKFKEIESAYSIDFKEYFSEDLTLLQPLIADGLLYISDDSIIVNPQGRLLIRNICMCFDIYLRRLARQQQFSRVI